MLLDAGRRRSKDFSTSKYPFIALRRGIKMYLNPVKSKVSNADEILNRASLQLKGIINVGTPENDVRKSKKSHWQSIEDISDISDISISEDSSEAKPKRANKFMKKKNDNDSYAKPFRTDHLAKEHGEKSGNTHANVGQNNNSSKVDFYKVSTQAGDISSDISAPSDSEASKMKDKFTKRNTNIINNKTSDTVENNVENKVKATETPQSKVPDNSKAPVTSKVKRKATLTFKRTSIDSELEESLAEIAEEDSKVEGEFGKVRGEGHGTDEEIKTDSYTMDDDVDNNNNEEADDDDDDDFFGNIQADASELIKAFDSEKNSQRNVNNDDNNNNDDDDDHHRKKVEQTSKSAFTFNASDSSKSKEDPFRAKSTARVPERSKSTFHATKDGKRTEQRKKTSRNDDDYDDDDIIEEESIQSRDDDDPSSIRTETYSSSPVSHSSKSVGVTSRSSRGSSSTRSIGSRSKAGTKSPESRSSEAARKKKKREPSKSLSTESSASHSYTTVSSAGFPPSEGVDRRSQRRLINAGVQTGVGFNLNENHWLFGRRQSYEFKFKDVERKFLTSREGFNSLIDITSFTPAMSCLNSIIKQQVALLATFVATQKSLHKQIIESTNRKAPYKYTALSDKAT